MPCISSCKVGETIKFACTLKLRWVRPLPRVNICNLANNTPRPRLPNYIYNTDVTRILLFILRQYIRRLNLEVHTTFPAMNDSELFLIIRQYNNYVHTNNLLLKYKIFIDSFTFFICFFL